MLRVDDLLEAGVHVDLLGVPGPLVLPKDDPVAKVHDEKDGDADVGGQKGRGGPLGGEKDGEAVDQAQQGEHDHGHVGAVGLDPIPVDGLYALDLASLAEPQVDDHAANPRGHPPRVGEVDEPVEHGGPVGRDVEVGEATKE